MKLKIKKKAIKSLSSNARLQNVQTPNVGGGAGDAVNSILSELSCYCDSHDLNVCSYTCW
ncbi:hypothetical protein L1077_13640 [Pseudoalteromonas luteoviolacea]|uniref:hypothetical protein n=1 Tax=Pseudoalteromonas luteoviolacea TaxID=43657 RepID=UPI001F35607E|nr:hypothetical protein [Pseudoalteromonas luteoviolacea]MCF6440474.1 hypothetical protein [Pseudoalteromonas luteoviolacea]